MPTTTTGRCTRRQTSGAGRSLTLTTTCSGSRRNPSPARTVGTSAVTYAYDALGRPTSVTDNNEPSDNSDTSTVAWTYTREGNGDLTVAEIQEYGRMANWTVTYTYDLAGRLKT